MRSSLPLLVLVSLLVTVPVAADQVITLANAGFEKVAPDGVVIDWALMGASTSEGASLEAST